METSPYMAFRSQTSLFHGEGTWVLACGWLAQHHAQNPDACPSGGHDMLHPLPHLPVVKVGPHSSSLHNLLLHLSNPFCWASQSQALSRAGDRAMDGTKSCFRGACDDLAEKGGGQMGLHMSQEDTVDEEDAAGDRWKSTGKWSGQPRVTPPILMEPSSHASMEQVPPQHWLQLVWLPRPLVPKSPKGSLVYTFQSSIQYRLLRPVLQLFQTAAPLPAPLPPGLALFSYPLSLSDLPHNTCVSDVYYYFLSPATRM